ncbi:hypothetical protein ACE1B6_21740 [Aerosakkonemataceae cyanobacterium BLCC-F154]|uniref:Uncharacterized protein n=1 Tax=Floridaenema fluviatile BLCC-F154 TaxID=3153640 RepID=A0ABV4YGC0_9CYAN
MSGVFELLEKIRTKPGMYIGRSSVSDLFMFLVGYEYGRGESGVDPTEEEDDFYGEFQPWLQKKFGIKTVSSWAKIIMLFCHDEKAGFEKFFQLLDEFKQRDNTLDENGEKVMETDSIINEKIAGGMGIN